MMKREREKKNPDLYQVLHLSPTASNVSRGEDIWVPVPSENYPLKVLFNIAIGVMG